MRGPIARGGTGSNCSPNKRSVSRPTRHRRSQELGRTEHKLSVERFGETLVITFGSETVQTFRRLGNAEGEIYSLDGGMLALVDGRFVLVAARDDGRGHWVWGLRA